MEEGEGVAGINGGVGGSGRGEGGGCALRRAKLVDVATLGSDISKIHLKVKLNKTHQKCSFASRGLHHEVFVHGFH